MSLPKSRDDLLDQRAKHVDTRWHELWNTQNKWLEEIVRTVTLANAGGAAAVLAFIGNSNLAKGMWQAPWALSFFLLGLVCILIFQLSGLHRVMNIFCWWRHETTKDYWALIENNDAWAALLKNDAQHHDTKWWQYLFGYGSFLSFCAGAVIGILGLFGK